MPDMLCRMLNSFTTAGLEASPCRATSRCVWCGAKHRKKAITTATAEDKERRIHNGMEEGIGWLIGA